MHNCKYVLLYRYLFSMERNRRVFKKFFPPQLFETFIDIGHYTRDLDSYTALMKAVNTLPVRNGLHYRCVNFICAHACT